MCEFGTHTLIVSMSIKEIDRHVRCAMRSCEKEPKASTATISNTAAQGSALIPNIILKHRFPPTS
jgi:hypothetical protein